MAKPVLSSTLRNMKFMQRFSQKEEKPVKEEEIVIPEGNFQPAIVKKCVVIMEGDPHPGMIRGRMSFMSFNPAIDKLNGEASNSHQPEESATSSGRQNETMSNRFNSSNDDDLETSKQETSSINEHLKRKQEEVVSEAQYPNKSQRNFRSQKESFNQHHRHHQQQQSKKGKLDWNVLRPPKSQGKNKRY